MQPDDPEQQPRRAAAVRHAERRRRRVRIGVSAAVVLVIVALGGSAVAAAARSAAGTGGTTIPLEETAGPSSGPTAVSPGGDSGPAPGDVLYVHVLGEVEEPGLYGLAVGARVVDAVGAAGGFTDLADPASVNLARTLTDGEQLIVAAPGQPAAPGASPSATGGGVSSSGALVDLNTATAEQLEELPRIGPALAERIVVWRTDNGPFGLVDELLAVPGIGDAILAGLADLVTV